MNMKTVLEYITENWFLLVALAAMFGVSVLAVCRFAGLPTEKQAENKRMVNLGVYRSGKRTAKRHRAIKVAQCL